MNSADPLYSLRNQFHIGNYASVIKETSLASNLPEPVLHERTILKLRSLLMQGKYSQVVSQCGKENADYIAIQLLARYHLGEPIVPEAKQFLKNNELNPLIAVTIGSIFYQDDLLEDALELAVRFPKDLECVGLSVQTFLKMNRADFAQKQVDEVKTWADDASLAQMIETWPAMVSGDSDQLQLAFYVYEELVASYGPTSKLLASQAACQLRRGFHDEAQALLATALELDPNHIDSLINMIACSIALGKFTEAEKFNS